VFWTGQEEKHGGKGELGKKQKRNSAVFSFSDLFSPQSAIATSFPWGER